jgi:hypothetical protein
MIWGVNSFLKNNDNSPAEALANLHACRDFVETMGGWDAAIRTLETLAKRIQEMTG